jgi:deoxyribose-phosphate aldolase
MELHSYIDHTLLKATATEADIRALCQEAIHYRFKAVCVNGCYVPLAARELSGVTTEIAAVVGFPLGASSTISKVAEARQCLQDGATEIDMVLNLGWLKSGLHTLVAQEIREVKNVLGERLLKVILETCYLSNEEISTACELAVAGGADFVKTSTGFGSGNATPEAVQLMKQSVGEQAQIKASGGIRDYQTALRYIQLGATRIGTSSGVAIVSHNNTPHESAY